MGRALTVARVRVPRELEAEYLAVLAELATLGAERGQHLWAFRSDREPQLFIEFSESRSAASHRHVASRSPRELELERRLRELATYEPGATDLWDEIPLEAAARRRHADARSGA